MEHFRIKWGPGGFYLYPTDYNTVNVSSKSKWGKCPTAPIYSGRPTVVLPYKNARVTLLLHKLRMDAAALDGVITDVDNTGYSF